MTGVSIKRGKSDTDTCRGKIAVSKPRREAWNTPFSHGGRRTTPAEGHLEHRLLAPRAERGCISLV